MTGTGSGVAGKDPRNIILKPVPKESEPVSEGIHKAGTLILRLRPTVYGKEKVDKSIGLTCVIQ